MITSQYKKTLFSLSILLILTCSIFSCNDQCIEIFGYEDCTYTGSDGTRSHIEISFDGKIINMNDEVDLATLNNGKDKTFEFTIKNSGNRLLVLSGNPLVNQVENNPEFEIIQPIVDVLSPQADIKFQIIFSPHSIGDKTTEISISSNDYDNEEFKYRVKLALEPEISLNEPIGTIKNMNPAFSWNNIFLTGAKYHLQISSDTSFSQEKIIMDLSDIDETEFILQENVFEDRTTYHWRISAIDELSNESDFSDISDFNIYMGDIDLISPNNNSYSNNVNETFVWDCSNTPSSYLLVLSTNEDLSNPIIYKANILDNTYTLETPLEETESTQYYWAVYPVDENNISGCSSLTYSLTLDTVAPIVEFSINLNQETTLFEEITLKSHIINTETPVFMRFRNDGQYWPDWSDYSEDLVEWELAEDNVGGLKRVSAQYIDLAGNIYTTEDNIYLKNFTYREPSSLSGRYGSSVCISGDGNVSIVRDNSFEFKIKIISDIASQNTFTVEPGKGMDINGDGSRAVISSTEKNIYLLDWNGSNWSFQTLYNPDLSESVDVAISNDGNTYVVSSGNKIYVNKYNGSIWTQDILELEKDGLGQGLSISKDGNTIIAGCPSDNTNGNYSGSVFVCKWNGINWNISNILPSDGSANKFFGYSSDVNYDGSIFVVGAPSLWDDSAEFDSGSAYVYKWVDGSYIEEKFENPAPVKLGRFGYSVAMSFDGHIIMIGENEYDYLFNGFFYGYRAGKIYIYQWNCINWNSLTYTGINWTGNQGHYGNINFAESLDISNDGRKMITGDSSYHHGSYYYYNYYNCSYNQYGQYTCDVYQGFNPGYFQGIIYFYE